MWEKLRPISLCWILEVRKIRDKKYHDLKINIICKIEDTKGTLKCNKIHYKCLILIINILKLELQLSAKINLIQSKMKKSRVT